MNTADRTATHRIGRIARALATAGIGLGIALASAAVASAEAQTERKSRQAARKQPAGTKTSSGPKGRISTCSYKSGTSTMIDVYQDGHYTHTLNESKPVVPMPPQVSNPGLAPSSPPPLPQAQNPVTHTA